MNDYETEGLAEYVMTLFPKKVNGVCVDIGAYAPKWLSNSWLFEEAGWDTYCVEPNHTCIAYLKQHRKHVLEYACGSVNADDVNLYVYTASPEVGEAAGTGLIDHCQGPSGEYHKTILSRVDKVKVRTVDWLMENVIKQPRIDFLSIDVERNEMAVLRGTDLGRWKPQVISIENLDYTSGQQLWLTNLGYRTIRRIQFNDIYKLTLD